MNPKCGGILLIGSIVVEITSFTLIEIKLLHFGRGFCWLLRQSDLGIDGS
jgi:hypothetical protein